MATGDPVSLALLVAALGCGTVGGVFFAFSTFVMAGLGRLPTAQGIAAMQSINRTVITPLFMIALFGTGILCLALAVWAASTWPTPRGMLAAIGSVLYIFGTILVTIAFNVPRNNRLGAVDAASADGAVAWSDYLATWTAWNHVRTVTGLAAAAAFILALCR